MTETLDSPRDFTFIYSAPEDESSKWYKEMNSEYISAHFQRLAINDFHNPSPQNFSSYKNYWKNAETYQYEASYCYSWAILPMKTNDNCQGHIFRKREYNYVEFDEADCLYKWYAAKYPPLKTQYETKYRLDNLADIKQACRDLVEELTWLRDEIHMLSDFGEKYAIRLEYDKRFNTLSSNIETMQAHYSDIFSICADSHNAPSAFYHLALECFEMGDHLRGLEYINSVLDRTNLHEIESHSASNVCLSEGELYEEIALYDEALISLKEAIDHNPKNKQAYFDQALSLFEKGRFEEAVQSFKHADTEIELADISTISTLNFCSGLIQGITSGSAESLANFVPSVFSSLNGLSHGIWAFACSPKDVTLDMVRAARSLVSFLTSKDVPEVLKTVFPEIKQFKTLNRYQDKEMGYIAGLLIGKYGTEFITVWGTSKAFKMYRNLKKANGALTLQTLAQIEKAQKIQSVSKQWWKKTAPIIKEIKKGEGRLGQELYKAFRSQTLSELQVRRVLHQAGFKTYARPKGIPASWRVEISKTGGGMKYVHPKNSEIHVRVMPGNPKNPFSHQKKPYVVQMKNGKVLSSDGVVVLRDTPEAHIPLEKYQFIGEKF